MSRFRLPLGGSYNTRVAATNSLSGPNSGTVGVGVVGTMIVGLGGQTMTKDQRFVNCFTERVMNPYTQKLTLYLVKRPGFAASVSTQASSIGNALLIWTGNASKIISAFGNASSSIYDSSTLLPTNNAVSTTITGLARDISEGTISNTATIAIASSDSTGWYYQPSGTVTKVSSAVFPGNNSLTTVGGFVPMDGYWFIQDSNGTIWNSDLNSIVNWTATSFVTANSFPDAGIGLVRKGNKIMAMGTQSVQFFYNAGNAVGSPLSRIEPMTLEVGCVSANAFVDVSGTIFWAGATAQGGLSVYQYDAQVSRISTPEIDNIILLAGAGNITMSATKFYGRTFVILQAGTITLVYCVEEKAWHEWASAVTLWYKCVGVSAGSSQVTYSISKTSTAGKLFTINPAALTFQDNGVTYTELVQTSLIGEGNVKTYWEEVELICDRQLVSSPTTISYTDDDYQTYTTLGTVDESDARPRFPRAGASYRRAWVLTNTTNAPSRIEALAGRSETGV